MTGARDAPVLIDDDETQRYVLTLDTEAPTEGAPIEATLAADPAHEDGVSRTTLKLRLDEPRYSLDAASRDGVRIGSDSIPGISASHTVTPSSRPTTTGTGRRTRSRCGHSSGPRETSSRKTRCR